MAFQRAQWHSGLTYQQTCRTCGTLVRYTDYHLDFRPWYADGFVYCPKCKTPLRHNENLAINEDGTPYVNPNVSAPQTVAPAEAPVSNTVTEGVAYCTKCGRRYNVGTDNFCAGCGNKLN